MSELKNFVYSKKMKTTLQLLSNDNSVCIEAVGEQKAFKSQPLATQAKKGGQLLVVLHGVKNF